MRVLLYDVESSGLSFDEGHRVIEVAAALFDTKYASVIESFSALLSHSSNDAEPINGIQPGLLLEHGDEPGPVWNRFLQLSTEAECFCAYNEAFDRDFLTKSIEALAMHGEVSILENWDPGKPSVDAMNDVHWGVAGSKSLTAVALGLGLGVASAHRAMSDVDLMARCFTRLDEILRTKELQSLLEISSDIKSVDVLEPIFRLGMRPKVRVVAQVSFERKDMAKSAGFMWNPDRREWFRLMAKEDVAALPFRAVERA
jgi:DNA polymerase-3 subunit epsilon